MFVVYYKAAGKPIRYFHPDGMQKTIKTAWAFPETVRAKAEAAGLKLRSIEASPMVPEEQNPLVGGAYGKVHSA